jgi:LytS/YehU family sensor histidine kinase
LEYLKYQLNPHFLMNTLNNIHALVDIDPELSKESIVELSKMLRFVLYEGNKPTVPLYHELDFLDHYITLMRLRYTDKVSITVNKPDELPNCEIPPLLFITVVENAFKHGVSYQQPSFIDISIQISDSQLKFSCRNSKIPNEEEHHGGIGLQNVKQRLDLIYGKNFTLDINNEPQEYNIQLTIPL